MATLIIGMYGAGTGGTQDALASIDVPQDGLITGIDWDVNADLDGDTESFQSEVSFIATNQLTNNDVRGRISSMSSQISLTTSGVANSGVQKFVGPLELPVAAGERIYLHMIASTGVNTITRCNLHLDVTSLPGRRSARR